MRFQVSCVISLALALNSVWFVSAANPGLTVGDVRFGSEKNLDREYQKVYSKIYNVIASVRHRRLKKCAMHIKVTGNGVGDIFRKPCTPNGVFTFLSEKYLVYGNPDQDNFVLFSDRPSTLYVFKKDQCSKRTYKTEEKKTIRETGEVSDEECKKIRNKIINIVDQQSKFLDNLDKQVDGKSAHSVKNGVSSGDSSLMPVNKDATSNVAGKPNQFTVSSLSDAHKSPLSLYAQYRDAAKAAKTNAQFDMSHKTTSNSGPTITDLFSVKKKKEDVSHQTTSINGVPVPELTSSKKKKDGVSIHQSKNGVTVTEFASTINKKDSSAQPATGSDGTENQGKPDSSNSHQQSIIKRIGSKVKSKVASHLHNPSGNGLDFTSLDKLLHLSH